MRANTGPSDAIFIAKYFFNFRLDYPGDNAVDFNRTGRLSAFTTTETNS